VTTYISGIPELVIDGVTGMVVPAGRPDRVADAIERLLVDREFRDRLTKDADALVRELHDLSTNVALLHDLIDGVRAREEVDG
jgi:glycosyltransferase involved in cell wall biosynthesis